MSSKHVTLDPEDWDEFKKLGHRMVEDAIDHLQNIRDLPMISQSEEISKVLTAWTEEGEGEVAVYDAVSKYLLPYAVNYSRPTFWGVVAGAGSPYGMLLDMLVSSRNAGLGSFEQLPIYTQCREWLQELLDIPTSYSGVSVSGGSEANFTGLAVARNAKAKVDMKKKGIQGVDKKMVLYGSEEMHHCLERSVELLGLGNEALRWIPVDENYSIRIDELEKRIKEDRKMGYHPFCIIGCAGTVNTGAFDDLNALADLCEKEDLWFHVDGAFGAWIKLSDTHRHLANGLERADSIAVDMHKWMSEPYVSAYTFVKDKLEHFKTFVYGHDAEYLKSNIGDRELSVLAGMSSISLSRRDKVFRTWMLLKAFGKKKYRQIIQQNLDDISYLSELIEKDPLMELTAPVVSNIVCFRYNPMNLSEEQLEKLNRMILAKLFEKVNSMITDTKLNGKYMLRACNVNHRTKKEDFDYLVTEIRRIGAELAT